MLPIDFVDPGAFVVFDLVEDYSLQQWCH